MKKHLTSLSVLVLGFVIGASALTAIAQVVPGWNPAPTTGAPNDNVSAPINTGATPQVKTGLLTLANFTFNSTGVANIVPGNVLTARDTSGTVEWKKQGFDFTSAGTQYSITVPRFDPDQVRGNTLSRVTVADASAKAVVVNINKDDTNNCKDSLMELYSRAGVSDSAPTIQFVDQVRPGLPTTYGNYHYLGYIFTASTDGAARDTGSVVTVPVSNGQMFIKSANSACKLKITKIADIY
ncbi:MAG: hypothetical protein AAB381_00045 [Patescibacteria group bacterium]